MDAQRTLKIRLFLTSWRQGVWILGVPAWLFGLVERGIAAWSDTVITNLDLLQVLIAAFFLLGWLLLKPNLGSTESDRTPFASANGDLQ
ncbi:hypothetical protein ACQ4M3_36715 [Leptolyngbya sp. AN03gr2]|uniref:hypothetical protein n=1 Tax=unclassified Leptolyngbya TaxID=2650499 RepID=UPI003D315B51